jgi:uncharacterized protein with HEPN domain
VEADYLIAQSSGLTWERFSHDETLRRAFVRSSKSLAKPPRRCRTASALSIRTSNGGRWQRMRDRLIHDYFGVDYELVWDVVRNRIPELRRQLAAVLEA